MPVVNIGTWITESNPSGHPLSDAFTAITTWFASAFERFAEWIARPGTCKALLLMKIIDLELLFLGTC
jgi:hypothetical protein